MSFNTITFCISLISRGDTIFTLINTNYTYLDFYQKVLETEEKNYIYIYNEGIL